MLKPRGARPLLNFHFLVERVGTDPAIEAFVTRKLRFSIRLYFFADRAIHFAKQACSAGFETSMLYEFRTLKDRQHASLIMLAGCDNDIEAILVAQQFLRKGEGLEVWRGDELVYRLAARIRANKSARPSGAFKTPHPRTPERPAKALPWLDAARRLLREGILRRVI